MLRRPETTRISPSRPALSASTTYSQCRRFSKVSEVTSTNSTSVMLLQVKKKKNISNASALQSGWNDIIIMCVHKQKYRKQLIKNRCSAEIISSSVALLLLQLAVAHLVKYGPGSLCRSRHHHLSPWWSRHRWLPLISVTDQLCFRKTSLISSGSSKVTSTFLYLAHHVRDPRRWSSSCTGKEKIWR